MSSVQKTYKKGEFLFKEGDKIQSVVFIQAGGVSQCLLRGKKNIELFQLGANHVLGEAALYGQSVHSTSAVATAETKTLEMSPEALKAQIDPAGANNKVLIKSLIDRLKMGFNEVKSAKLAGDSVPCAPEIVPQVFAAIYYCALHKGEKETPKNAPERVVVDWTKMKSYAQRVFGQSPKRLEQAVCILAKLKLAEFEMGKLPEDPKGPDVIVKANFFDVPVIEGFFEFYQYYFYKPGKSDILKYDEFCSNLLEVFVAEGTGKPIDRFGAVSLPFPAVAEKVKEKTGLNLNQDHFARLETKGVLCKRKTTTEGVTTLDFEFKEFKHILFSWKIIREIEKWNEKGFVDMNEKEEKKEKKSGPSCPQCAAEIAASAKFCQECGAKIVAAA